MRFGYTETCLDHDPGARHPESPDRLRAIRRGLAKKHGVEYVDPAPAEVEDAVRAHEAGYIDEIQAFCETGGGNWDPDTVATEATWPAALASAGLSIWAAQEAVDGASGRKTPFALGRPPGHHATADDAMGFCFINNAAVAAEAMLESAPEVDRVAIFDWDVHHGNGTQDIFYDREDVFYGSIHEDGLYPGTGLEDETGDGSGHGTTLNTPLPAGASDADYCAVWDELFAPAIEAFDPDLFLVSAGFDAHRHDPISRMHVTTEGYGLLTERVRDVADVTDAALAFVLEGGYSMDTLSEGVSMVHEVFDGRDPVSPEEGVQDDVTGLIDRIESDHQGVGEK